jgi:hypothetical protein
MKHTAHLLAGIALLAGCSGEPITTETNARFELQGTASQSFGADVNKQLAALRQVTASYQQFENGRAAGWSTQITPCMTDPGGS